MTVNELIQLITGRNRAVDPDLIEDMEAEIDDGFPESYRAFLNKCAGGTVARYVMFRSQVPGVVGDFCIDSLLGDEPGHYLSNAREDYWGRIPEELRPIGHDPYGNVICIGIAESAREQIYFWNYEEEPDCRADQLSVDEAANVYLVAPSFEAFVSMLAYEASASQETPNT